MLRSRSHAAARALLCVAAGLHAARGALVGAPGRPVAAPRCALAASAAAPNATIAAVKRKLVVASLERCLVVADLECRAEACDAAGDVAGAVEAYSELLALQPPDSPDLSPTVSARRGLQELLRLR